MSLAGVLAEGIILGIFFGIIGEWKEKLIWYVIVVCIAFLSFSILVSEPGQVASESSYSTLSFIVFAIGAFIGNMIGMVIYNGFYQDYVN